MANASTQTQTQDPAAAAAASGAAPAAAKKEAPVAVIVPIGLDRMRNAEHGKCDLVFHVPAGLEPEQLLPVAYWTHVASHFVLATRPGVCHLHCYSEDGRWYAEYLVRDAGQNWAKVSLLRKHALESVHLERRFTMVPGHTVQWSGNFTK